MGSHASKESPPNSLEAATVIVSRTPQEIVDEILGYLFADSDTLQSCALVSKSWVPSCRRYLFYTIVLTPRNMVRWLEIFPVPEKSPAHHTRHLRFPIGRDDDGPKEFFEYTPWFTNVEGVDFFEHKRRPPSRIPSFWRLPPSATSLTLNANTVTLPQVQSIMVQLPNLENLSLSWYHTAKGEEALPRIGLRGRFGGELQLHGEHGGVMDMLSEVPTGLHFTKVEVHSTSECLLSTVRLVEACSKTLVKLSYTTDSNDCWEAFGPSFDFSEFPNLQEVHFGIDWMGGGLPWVPTALSTLRPTTSPRLLAIKLRLACSYLVFATQVVEAVITDAGDDLQRVADEVARVEREFGGVVKLGVHQSSVFKEVTDTLNIFQHLGH